MTTTTSPDKRTYAFGADDRVAIVAGGGRLPVDVAEGLAKQGHRTASAPRAW